MLGSEHGVAEMVKGARLAQAANPDVDVVLIGPGHSTEALPEGIRLVPAADEADQHKQMEGFSTLMRSPPA